MSVEQPAIPSTQPGTVGYIVQHLATWLSHRRPGMLWVEYRSAEARESALAQLAETYDARGALVSRVDISHAFSREDWENIRSQIEGKAGIVHVVFAGSIGSVRSDPRIRKFAVFLNLDRERIFSANSQQIWWIPAVFAHQLRDPAPDFLSWITIRLRLDELPAVSQRVLAEEVGIRSGQLAGQQSIDDPAPEIDSPPLDTDDPEFVEPLKLLNESIRLHNAGKLRYALSSAGEAVYGFRQLSYSNTSALPNLAQSLSNLSRIQRDLGQLEQALAAIQEAVNLHRELAAARPGAFRPDLARSLDNLSNRLRDVGQREPALAAIQEAVAIRHELAAARPHIFRPSLALSLNNLSLRLSDIGQREPALAAIQEAVILHRLLAADQPDVFRPFLAGSLNNLSGRLSDVGQYEAALDAVQESVSLCRQADTTRPMLAGSLNNLSHYLSKLGQPESALRAIEEAVLLHRDLAASHPDPFRSYLARSLNNLARVFTSLGQNKPALAAIQEAVVLHRDLAAARPEVFRPDLANSVFVLGRCQAALGNSEASLKSALEALTLLRPYFISHPAAFSELARACVADYQSSSETLNLPTDPALLKPYLDYFNEIDAKNQPNA